jgi:hypothetical protein
LQGRDKEQSECQVIPWFLLDLSPIVKELEAFQVLKQSDEVYDLLMGTFGFPQGERVDCG